MSTIISPSLLSANFANLQSEIDMINRSDADWLHLDMSDGVFAPNITFGFPVIAAVRQMTNKPLDFHLMTVQPERYIDRVAKAGGWLMTVHVEECRHLHRTLQDIHAAGMKAGVALNPATPICMLENVMEDLDLVLLMGVDPGFSGQKFISHTVKKVEQLRKLIQDMGSKAMIEVDGGVDAVTGPMLVKAGADALVSGSYVFQAPNPEEAIHGLHLL